MNPKQKLDAFINKIDSEEWTKLSGEKRLELLQEFENIMAEIEKRPANEVKIIDEKFAEEHPYTAGYHNETGIYLNPNYFGNIKNIPGGVSRFTLAKALNTVAHEGRHAWQEYVIKHSELDIVSIEDRLALVGNDYPPEGAIYIQPENDKILYRSQICELDARRFAREVLGYINKGMTKKLGKEDKIFADAIHNDINNEMQLAAVLLLDGKDKDLDKIDEKVIEYYKEKGIDFSKNSIFAAAKELLRTGDIYSFVYGPSIKINGPSWLEEETDIKEKIDDKEIKVEKPKIKFM